LGSFSLHDALPILTVLNLINKASGLILGGLGVLMAANAWGLSV
jgi:hypothetical protein